MRNVPRFVRPLFACAVVTALVVAGEVAGWATNVCQKPSPNMTLCYGDDNYITTDCTQYKEGVCSQYHLANINQFPAGAITAVNGTTTQVAADCWQRKVCLWNTTVNQCQPQQNWGAWNLADKTIVGTNQCPTNEE